jgi:hypothetical protein
MPFGVKAQTDILVLKKNGMHVRTYTTGSQMTMKTIYDQWFSGMITNMRHDSVYLNGMPFHFKEIAAIHVLRINFANTILAGGMLVSGGGIFLLGAVNGIYRGDDSKDWYTTSGLITGGALLIGGFLLTRTHNKNYRIGRKFALEYLTLNPNKN